MKPVFAAIIACFLLFCAACTKQQNEQQRLSEALKHYNRLLTAQNADSLAQMYTPDGEMLGNGKLAAFGRDSIRSFLASFSNIEVASNEMPVDSVRINGNTALQFGTYKQTAIINKQDTVRVKGEFTATWQRNEAGAWFLKRMETRY